MPCMTKPSLARRYDRLVERLVEELRRYYGARLVAVAVFGSVGRGTQRDGSDVDVLIIARGLPAGRLRRVEEFLPIEGQLEADLREAQSDEASIALAPVFKTPEEVEHGSPLFLDMVEDARVVHDPAGFLAGYLERLRVRLRELGARRVWLGNAWYWELKPDLQPGEVIRL